MPRIFPLKTYKMWPIVFFLFLCISCVSLNFNLPQDQKAKGVVFQPPPIPYKEILKEGMDSAYENSQNKNIIAFFSNCSASTRFTDLTEFQKDLLGNLKSFQVQTQTESTHQDQKAFQLSLRGTGGGAHHKQMQLFLFKKEQCFYALSFLTTAPEETPVFKNFIQEFKAP